MLADRPDVLRLWLTFGISALGILSILATFLVAVSVFGDVDNPGEVIVAILGPVTAVVGTLAGYVAGQAAGAAGREKAEDRAQVAQERADASQDRLQAVIDVAPTETLHKARESHPEAFVPESEQQP